MVLVVVLVAFVCVQGVFSRGVFKGGGQGGLQLWLVLYSASATSSCECASSS